MTQQNTTHTPSTETLTHRLLLATAERDTHARELVLSEIVDSPTQLVGVLRYLAYVAAARLEVIAGHDALVTTLVELLAEALGHTHPAPDTAGHHTDNGDLA